MSSKKRPRVCTYNGTATEPWPLPIPFDLRLDVLSRLDVASLLRYAAASRSTRSDILSEDFCRSLALRAEASRGFDPALLLGFSYRLPVRASTAGDRVAQTRRQHLLRFDAILLDSFDPVASRDGLVVLLRRPTDVEQRWADALSGADLRVCNSLTGQASRLPPADVREAYPHALLAVGGAGRSFRLLAADSDLRTQTFSSEDGRWGAVVEPRQSATRRTSRTSLRDMPLAPRSSDPPSTGCAYSSATTWTASPGPLTHHASSLWTPARRRLRASSCRRDALTG
ncbi:uncharacterized protein [Miscanthus floridulus]|uniref:uncharacterized protein n=1 Tax=Miscanthus floridulus TaxID=154761 RepID=UPI003459A9EC